MRKPTLTAAEIEELLAREFPQAFYPGSGLSVEEVDHGRCRVRQQYRDHFIRPGGTISGPTMMTLADFAMYVAVLAAIGPVPLAVGEVNLYSEGEVEPVAHVTSTYSIPPVS